MKQTTVEYTKSSSLHGMQYIFEIGKNLLASKIIWVAIVCAAIITGIIMSVDVSKQKEVGVHCTNTIHSIIQAYIQWDNNPVLTSLHTTAKPISELDFPSITICGQGSISEVRQLHDVCIIDKVTITCMN